ncbi:MAG: universal stress protein [Brevundimonas sp.]|jgi:nucleotide-binding universal stress UspA family protein|nr:MAG: universal stress protein [Brevundimonas sp.]
MMEMSAFNEDCPMAMTDILLHIDSYPEPASPQSVARGIAIAGVLGGTLTGLVAEVAFPVRSNHLADYLIDLTGLARDEEGRSRRQCDEILIAFAAAAGAAGVPYETLQSRAQLFDISGNVASAARTRDLCIVPLGGTYDGQQDVARAVLFDSGKPVIVFDDAIPDRAQTLDLVVLAWDGSRAAARAMADAMPILKQAGEVRVVTVAGDKPGVDADRSVDVLRHLAGHGVKGVAEVVPAQGEGVGQILSTYVAKRHVDLLVMGAFGHSRVRDFILGGATQHMLSATMTAPVMLSH